MKVFKTIIAAAALLSSVFISCTKNHGYEDNTAAEIHLYQIAGTWRLSSWNGQDMSGDGTYCYLVLTSKDSKFDIYQNVDSPYSRHLTGSFSLVYDGDPGTNTISGWYDYNAGLWTSAYLISDVTEDSMKWTSADGTDVCTYSRCDAVPDEILSGTKSQL